MPLKRSHGYCEGEKPRFQRKVSFGESMAEIGSLKVKMANAADSNSTSVLDDEAQTVGINEDTNNEQMVAVSNGGQVASLEEVSNVDTIVAEAEELEEMVHEISEFSEETVVEIAESEEEVAEEEASVTEGDPPEEEQEEEAAEDDEGDDDEEEDEDEEEPEDPADSIRESCTKSASCRPLLKAFDACEERVNSKSKTEETCLEEYIDFIKCRDKCVSRDLFAKLK